MAAFRLARTVGEWNVDAMVDSMPSPLFAEWCEFLAREPMPEGFFVGLAGLAANVARMLGIKNVKVDDFMLRFGGEVEAKKEMSSDDMETVFRAMALAQNEFVKNG